MSFLDFDDEPAPPKKLVTKNVFETEPRMERTVTTIIPSTPAVVPQKPAWDGSSDELKLIYHIVTGSTSHTTKKEMLRVIRAWTEES